MGNEAVVFRRRQRWLAYVERGGEGAAKCDLCGINPANHYHEIISRGRTVGNDEARHWSYHRYLCSCLCEECHFKHAPKQQVATLLLARNCRRYGHVPVRRMFNRTVKLLRTPIAISFPRYTIGGHTCHARK